MRHVRSFVVCCLVGVLMGSLTGCGVKGTRYEEGMYANLSWFLCISLEGYVRHYYDGFPSCDIVEVKPAKSTVAFAGEKLFLSASAHVTGALGTDWRSDVELHNPGDDVAALTIRMLIHRNSNSSSPSVSMTVQPGQSIRLADVLDSEFGRDGQAALLISVGSGRIVVTSRTYNLLADGNDLGLPGGSTFGQYISALSDAHAIRFGEEGRLIQLSHSSSSEGGFRTNLGIVNVTDADLHVDVDLYEAGGSLLGTVPVNLGAYGYRQVNQVFANVSSDDVDDGYAVVSGTTPSSLFLAYASVVDNLTGDPIAISASRVPVLEPQGAGGAAWVVAAAHVAGTAGTNWRSDLEVHCWGDVAASYDIELLEHGADNSEPTSRSYTLAPGASTRFEDVLASEFGFEGQAALRVKPAAGHVLVTSRTFNLLGAGNPTGLPSGATFGQYIPGVSVDHAIRFGEEGRLIQLSHDPTGASGFRTNLVLVSASAASIDVEVDLYRSTGALLGTESITLAPFEYRQINRVFERVTSATIDDGFAVVRTTSEHGAVFALASVVDNLTGDPVGLGAVHVRPAAAEAALGQLEAAFGVLGQTTIASSVDGIQEEGVDGLTERFVSSWPGVISSSAGGFEVDYGEGTETEDGAVWSGSVSVDTSGMNVGGSRITGTTRIMVDGLELNGEPLGSSTSWIFDLEERPDGTVVGEVSAVPDAGNSSAGSVSGTIMIDTAICEKYPIAGTLTFISGGEVTTLAPSPECDGTLVPAVVVTPPGYDFVFNSADPWDPRSNAFITSTSNAEVATEGNLGGGYWRPMMGAETFEATTPGVITFHYGFDRPVAGGNLLLTLATFHWSYSQGHAFLYGSTDGASWQQLVDLEPPEGEGGRGGGWNGPLPAMFIGADDIWLQVRLYSYGPSANRGGVYCNTAQMFRYDPRQTSNTFELMVDLEE